MPTITPPSITALPAAPDPNNRATFNALAYPWSVSLSAFGTQVSALGTNVKANADEAHADAVATAADRVQTGLDRAAAASSAGTASTKAGEALASANASAASAASAAAIAGAFTGTSTTSLLIAIGSKSFATQAGEQYTAGVWMTAVSTANSANWMFGQVTSYSDTALVLDVQAIGGSGTYASWNLSLTGARGAQGLPGLGITEQSVGFKASGGITSKTLTVDADLTVSALLASVAAAGANLVRSARTSNTALTTTDKSKLIDITSGTFTQTFGAVATLADGWFCYLRNSGAGDITLDPSGAELIDGLTSYVMYPGECRLVQCDGTALRSVVITSFYKTFITSGTFVKPPGYSVLSVIGWPGGSGGNGGGRNDGSGKGGNGGSAIPMTIGTSLLSSSMSVVIGAGGSGGASGSYTSTAGGIGGVTEFGSIFKTDLVASPGLGYTGGLGGALVYGTYAGLVGAGSLSGGGGGGGGGGQNSLGGTGGGSLWVGAGGSGGNGGETNSNAGVSAGAAGQAPAGGGGGGGQCGTNASGGGGAGGAGARGEIRIWGII